MPNILKLPKNLIDVIAAGEVVERPASVVKELMENAIDAGSTKVTVRLKNFGIDLIDVEDNGHGIAYEDANLLLEQHATSKLSNEEDLERIGSFGFRGEALASIASVASKIEVKSFRKGSTAFSLSKENELSIEKTRENIMGTRIQVHSLFEKIPARKKFLKKGATELKHIVEMFCNTALPHLNVQLELYHNNKLIQKFSKTDSFETRIYELAGKEIAKNLLSSEFTDSNISVKALVGDSFIGQKTNRYQYLYINGRFVKNNLISAAIAQAYKGFLHKDLKPVYFLFLQIPFDQLDVNVHPRKLEVKFYNEGAVFHSVYKAALNALQKHDLSAIEDMKEDEKIRETPHSEGTQRVGGSTGFYTPKINTSKVRESMDFHKSLYSRQESESFLSERTSEKSRGDIEDSQSTAPQSDLLQLFNTYILLEMDEEVIFIDQHAAAEKIMFDKIANSIGSVLTKPLLTPLIKTLRNRAEKEAILDMKDDLHKLGMIIEDFGDLEVQVQEIPELASFAAVDDVIEDLLSSESDLPPNQLESVVGRYNITRQEYLRIASIACHGSIRAGQRLSTPEMRQLVSETFKLQSNPHCPHGRPVMWKLGKKDIEKNFNRNI